MLLPFASLLSFVVLGAKAQDTNIAEVVCAFEAANIPWHDIDITFRPNALLEVTFPQASGPAVTIHAAEQVPRNQTVGPPVFRLIGDDSRGLFVVAAVDPDPPTPQDPTEAKIRHFLGGNFVILAKSREGLLSIRTPAISEFLQPTPPAGSDAHRYIFLVFNQPAEFNEQTLVAPSTSITNFDISAFAQSVGLGNPIAGTFMLVAPDATSV